MSDVTQCESTSTGTTSMPRNNPVNRNTTTRNNNISDFFRARIPQLFRPVQTPLTPTPVPPPLLIPAQLIVDQPATPPLLPTTPQIAPQGDLPPPLPPTTARLTPDQRLEQAQTTWAAMLNTSRQTNVTDGHRPIILSVENQRINESWGDTLMEKQTHVTRIYGMNVNGLSLDKRGGQLDVLCNVINEVQADVFCGQEHNLDTDNTQVRQILYQTARHHWKRSRITFGTTPIPFSKHYKPGGTFMITAGDLTGRVIEQKHDKWGRWVSQLYQGQGSIKIIIYSAYQVVDKKITLGCITTASQQQSLLIQAHDSLTNPRSAFRRDLTTAIQASITSGYQILLMGDFNEAFGSDVDGIQKLATTCGLIDLMTVRHSSTPPATYARGRTRLDYALATDHIVKALSHAGYEPFNSKFPSDHRAYFFDFDTQQLFGTDTQNLGKHADRILRSNNVTQATQYIKAKYDLLLEHNAFERGEQLTLQGDRHLFAERLDRDVVRASLAAEQQMKKFGAPPWSVALDKARKNVTRLTKCLSMARTGLDTTTLLVSTSQASWDEPFIIPTTIQDCSTQLREAKRKVQDIVNTSFPQRAQERLDRITELISSPFPSDKTHGQLLRRLQKAEDVKQLFRKLKALRTSDQRHGVTRIEIPLHPGTDPKACHEWRQIEVPTEVLFQLQQRNRTHFGQARGSPFTVPPLVDQLGFCGDGTSSDDILNGEYDATGLDENVALLIQHLKQSAEMAAVISHPTITEQEYIGKLKVWKESTSTSPSGLHLGHYKALIARHDYSAVEAETIEENAKKEEWDHMQSCLLRLHVQQLNYALERGYAYMRWRTVVNTILFKDPDNVRIHRTRVIHIYEADYNLMLGIKWRVALYQAEAFRELNDGQFGSRPRRNAIDPVFIEEMQFEISRASRKMLVQTNYDATSCYDRIIPNLAMLVSRKYGVPKLTTKSNASTLEHAEYRIRTELGVSDTGYTHSPEFPIYGTGQGSGNSPMIWCFLSSVLFDCYDDIAYAATYCHPDRTQPMELGMVGFVDDSNGQTNHFLKEETVNTLPTILYKLRHNAQAWSNILGASGGALELSKCSCHLMVWNFTERGDPVLVSTRQSLQHPAEVTDPVTNTVHALTFLSPHTAHKTLGHYKEPAGTQMEQFRQLRVKSDKSTEFIWKCHLTPKEAWTYYYACYLPSIGYPLSCSSLTYAQLDRVQRTAMTIIIARCGYNRNTKREIIYGPMSYGGANFRHLYMHQGVGQLTMFMRHWRQPHTIPGKLLKCAVAWNQMSAGTSYSIFQRVYEELPHLDSKWLASMRSFMSEIDASMDLADHGVPPLQRTKDSHIMDHIMGSKLFTALQIRRLNYCRLFLQAVTISDLTDATGQRLDQSKLRGIPNSTSSTTTWLHVSQERPSEEVWTLWRKANLIWSQHNGTLHQPLGQWLLPRAQQRQQHFAYLRHRRLYIRVGSTQYQVCTPTINPGEFRFHTRVRQYSTIKSDAHPVLVTVSGFHPDHWQVNPITHPIQIITPPARAETFAAFVDTLEPWEIDVLRMTTLNVDPNAICAALSHGLRAASDGSVRFLTQGAFGWALSTDQGIQAATGMGPARGPRPSSYRAEGYGLLSILRFLIRIAEFTGRTEPWIGVLVTDSQSVLKTLGGGDKEFHATDEPVQIDGNTVVLDVLCPDWDILIEIQHALTQLPELQLKFIKGHQDATVPYAQLPLLARLNVDADAKAGQFQDLHGQDRPIVLLTPRTHALLHILEGTITSSFATTLRHAYCGPPLMEYIRTRNNWTEATLASVNWQAHGSAIRKQLPRRLHYVKLVHDILPTHSRQNRIDKGKRTCPCCHHPKEDRDHILRCPARERNEWRQKLLKKLAETCSKQRTYAPLQKLLLDAVRQWLYPGQEPPDEPQSAQYAAEMHQLIETQTRIGWRQLFNGRFSKQWSEIQNVHLNHIRRHIPWMKNTGQQWQVAIITVLWEEWHDLWKMRNSDVHGKDEATRAIAENREVSRRLSMIYDQRHHMEPSAQSLLFPDIQTHLEQPMWVIQNWITINGPVFVASLRTVKTKAIQHVRSIRSYFAPV
jgi:exonuclease III